MPSGSNQQQSSQEQALLNHIKRLERSGSNYLAVWVHLSKLITIQRLPECLEVVRTMLARDAKKFDASLFALFNNDIFIVCGRDASNSIDGALGRVCQVVGNDPFFAAGDSAQQDFYTYFDLGDQFGDLVDCVEALVQSRAEQDHLARSAKRRSGEGKPLDLSNLATIEKAIAQADLSAMTNRQAVCELGGKGRPTPLFYELFTSIGTLRQTLMPDQNLFSNHWLFQYLTTKLDERMLAWLSKNDDSTLKRSFSLNINIASILSPRFLEFDALLDKERRNTIAIELQKVDVFADISRFLFTQEFLKDRGYRICLDGLTAVSLPYVDRRKLGFELIKLHWTPQLRQLIEGKDGEHLREVVKATNPQRIILMRCETDDAIELGQELGISLFQGYYIDHLLKEKITREEAAERLGAAMNRQRRVAGPPQPATVPRSSAQTPTARPT